MDTPTLYIYDLLTGAYAGSRPAQVVNGKPLTKSACATTTPPPDAPVGHVARWTGSAWEVVEDHRQHMDSTGIRQGGTPYWLPDEGDDYTSPPRYMDALGPLPEGAVTERPEKPAPTDVELFARLRAERDRRLALTDYAMMPDYPLTSEQKVAVTIYRQALRDLPAQEGAPWDGGGELTPWPEEPSFFSSLLNSQKIINS